MDSFQLVGLFWSGLVIAAYGAVALRLRNTSGLTKREIRRYDDGAMIGAKFFLISGLLLAALAGIGWIFFKLRL